MVEHWKENYIASIAFCLKHSLACIRLPDEGIGTYFLVPLVQSKADELTKSSLQKAINNLVQGVELRIQLVNLLKSVDPQEAGKLLHK